MATNAYTSDNNKKLRGVLAPFILRVKEYVQPKRQLIRLTYTHEKFPVRTVVLLQITKETFTVYESPWKCKNKTGGTETKSLRAEMVSLNVFMTNDSAINTIGCVNEMHGAQSVVHHLHECTGYSDMYAPHMSAERIRLSCVTDDMGLYINIGKGLVEDAPYGFDEGERTFINDTLFIDPKTKRIDTRAPMIDGWKLDIKYMGYD